MMVPGQTLILTLFYTMQGLGLIKNSWGVILSTIRTTRPFAIFTKPKHKLFHINPS